MTKTVLLFCSSVISISMFLTCNTYGSKNPPPTGEMKNDIPQSHTTAVLTVKDFGAIGNGTTDDSKAIRDAIKSGLNPIVFPHGVYKISSSIELPTRTMLIGNKSTIKYSGTDSAIKAMNNSKNKLSLDCEVNNLLIEVSSNGAKAVDASNFQYSNFTGLALSLKAKNTVGLYLQGNGKGTAPYYNSFSNLYIVGGNDKKKYPNQVGIKLDDNKVGGFSASGANANFFSNIKRIAGVAIAVDLVAGTGNMFENVQTESIQDTHFRLNHRAADYKGKLMKATRRNTLSVTKGPTNRINGDLVLKGNKGRMVSSKIVSASEKQVTIENSISKTFDEYKDFEIYEAKAAGNKFINLRGEGARSSAYIRLCYGAMDNSFKDFEYTSISATSIIRETNSLTNVVGTLIPMTFYVKDVKANSKTQIVPFKGPHGGIPISMKCRVDGVHIKATKQSKGTCKLVVKRNSGLIELAPYLNNQNPFSNFEILKKYDSGSNARLRPGDGLQLELVTSKDWNSNDVTVTVWLAI